ncbi:Bug family tripartite tricarboxylate transporter substrate binding protein [Variovorax saccharolyticus]|uniref:Bug family tripartite tricarboxylate transporter substrate binding protein n=1 Tax=Variovorax saccharolyticus TaxID=3053516 RepID=UPI0025786CB1|nr:tripartite tricarboxylate transporter substrate binding protein [Variovorax sp. J22R187]MDM0021155.1 tripartite tricarboxylate transporter substrate binding protein [Variovorax sp. J22R187]
MRFPRKTLQALGLSLFAAFGIHAAAAAGDFPSQPIKLVVVYQAGGANDIVARVLAERMTATLGQPVMVLNKPGASGAIGAQFVAGSPADGHTVLMGGMPLVVARAMYAQPPVDFEKSLAPVGKAVNLSMVLVARQAFPGKTFGEAVEMERSKPGSVSMAVTASTYEFYHARINKLARTEILKVPYSGVPAAMQDLNGNRVDLLIDTLAAQKPFIDGGSSRPLAVFGERRLAALPEVPTLSELGLKGFTDQPYVGMLVPKGTPQAAVRRLNEALNEALARPEVRERMDKLGLAVAPGTPEAFLKEMKADSDRFVEVGAQAGIEKQQ